MIPVLTFVGEKPSAREIAPRLPGSRRRQNPRLVKASLPQSTQGPPPSPETAFQTRTPGSGGTVRSGVSVTAGPSRGGGVSCWALPAAASCSASARSPSGGRPAHRVAPTHLPAGLASPVGCGYWPRSDHSAELDWCGVPCWPRGAPEAFLFPDTLAFCEPATWRHRLGHVPQGPDVGTAVCSLSSATVIFDRGINFAFISVGNLGSS